MDEIALPCSISQTDYMVVRELSAVMPGADAEAALMIECVEMQPTATVSDASVFLNTTSVRLLRQKCDDFLKEHS